MTHFKPRRILILAGSLLFLTTISSAVIARVDEFPKGTLIEKVVCESDASQSYALYLPSTYTPQVKWPVIYAFDPDGRGDEPVRLYREAAEKYGYIVAGTYNTKNGMQNAPLQAAISKLIADTRARFSIDEKRVYTTGFSGGARVATRVASSCGGCVAGVIACGAGFPSDIKPTETTAFVFFGTVGVDDFNFPELMQLDNKLTKVPHRIAIFSGQHEWASSSLLVEALEWIEIQAMRTGRTSNDEAFIEEQWKKGLAVARGNENRKNLYEAFKNYRALAVDFKGLKDTSVCESRSRELKETKEVKQAIKDEQAQIKEQLEIARSVIALGSVLLTSQSKRNSTLKKLTIIIDDLRVKARNVEDSRERRIARRSIRQVLAETYEAAMFSYLPRQQFDVALVNLEVAGLVLPDSWGIPYEMARAFALSGEKRKALEALRMSVAKGLNDPRRLETQKDFDAIRNEKEFEILVKKLKQESLSK